MIPKEKWLKNVNAVATSRGWVHPKTGELLKSVRLQVDVKEEFSNDTTSDDIKQEEVTMTTEVEESKSEENNVSTEKDVESPVKKSRTKKV